MEVEDHHSRHCHGPPGKQTRDQDVESPWQEFRAEMMTQLGLVAATSQ